MADGAARRTGWSTASPEATKEWQEFRQAAGALADWNRLRILRRLVTGAATVTELTQGLELRQPLVSHHLSVLADAGLVSCERQGRRRLYTAHPQAGTRGASLVLGAIIELMTDEVRTGPPQGELHRSDGTGAMVEVARLAVPSGVEPSCPTPGDDFHVTPDGEDPGPVDRAEHRGSTGGGGDLEDYLL